VRRSLTRYRAIWPLLAYTLLTLGMTYPLARHFFTAIPGDGFDGWQNLWNLWWMRQALLVEHRSPYFTDLLYYPTGVSLLFHTLNPFNGLISLPLQLAAGLYVAYNSVVVFSFAVGGLGAFLLARYTLRAAPAPARTWASLLAGAIYTFSPYHNAHLLGHMQLIALEWIPFYALYLCRSLDRAAASPLRARDLVLPALFLVLVASVRLVLLLLLRDLQRPGRTDVARPATADRAQGGSARCGWRPLRAGSGSPARPHDR
jgi:hypothetical protein